jgi:hypothetical protein
MRSFAPCFNRSLANSANTDCGRAIKVPVNTDTGRPIG